MTQITPILSEPSPVSGDQGVLVRVEGVSKRFCRSLKKSLWYGVQDIASELVGRKYEHELRRGECLGLIDFCCILISRVAHC